VIVLDNVSKFYGEVLGVNRVTLSIDSGITSLVGPNGSGKTTLMNLIAGLLRPTKGTISVLGTPVDHPKRCAGSWGTARSTTRSRRASPVTSSCIPCCGSTAIPRPSAGSAP
jgi:ABC-type Fe3+/spermidine/putrescine transport system ATPase subunit